ncbi:DUF1840 domain-containing protein [Methylobacillus gramineus]|uniref:DUF1840 domain-containing protein n=1 Tax=Methylobacillus gramineus TaxID=755169 RepID=UPI001CFFA7D0|nr:DUF1840 domain-containing protein [Methylobacillus gramineus]MCB5184068.1 DUF1840 domain-containing protein [Methylobacillus gramineus]
MLVTFSTARYSDITMFGDVVSQLLKLMGHSGTVPGAILAADVPQALAQLKQGLSTIPASAVNHDNESQEPNIGLPSRALPLIKLLESAISNQSDVMWK